MTNDYPFTNIIRTLCQLIQDKIVWLYNASLHSVIGDNYKYILGVIIIINKTLGQLTTVKTKTKSEYKILEWYKKYLQQTTYILD